MLCRIKSELYLSISIAYIERLIDHARMNWAFRIVILIILSFHFSLSGQTILSNKKADGFNGIWFDLGQYSEFGSKYSGGLGTYTAKHVPLAIYSPEANKTFFVYGGSRNGERYLLCMASCFDHDTGLLAKPTIVHDKEGVDDPHDNLSLAIDDKGYIWVFISGRGQRRPGFKYKSVKPYNIDAFQRIEEMEMTYPQPWHIKDQGFMLLFTKYTKGRELYFQSSTDGHDWTKHQKLAGMGGHYQTSFQKDGRVITAFNRHPGGTADLRTDLYFTQTFDFGKTWKTIDGEELALPLIDFNSPALVEKFSVQNQLVYLKDIRLDNEGNPAILIITSHSHQPGPDNGLRLWRVVRWTGKEWNISTVTTAFHNYDQGSLIIKENNVWQIIAPTETGPQEHGTGGEVALWESQDQGDTWTKLRDVTQNSPRNHAYCRSPINAHTDFFAFWADGNPDKHSPSFLYFTNQSGDTVWRMPENVTEDWMKPEEIDF